MSHEPSALESPSPETMVVVLLGASEYPGKPEWSNPVLRASAHAFRGYALSPAGLALSPSQILDLFDDDAEPAAQLLRLKDFLAATASTSRDLILYYVGHGGFHGDEYHLSVRRAQRDLEFLTTIESRKLAQVVHDGFRRKRVYVFLDSCFAASAAADWQGAEIELAVRKMREPLPPEGTVFLAAASKDDVTHAPRAGCHTVFTGAVLAVLAAGIESPQPKMSMYELYDEVRELLRRCNPDAASRPELHVPRQREGDVSLLRVFPNPGYLRADTVRDTVARVGDAVPVAARGRDEATARARAVDQAGAQVTAAEQATARARDEVDVRAGELVALKDRIAAAMRSAGNASREAAARTHEAEVARARMAAAERAAERSRTLATAHAHVADKARRQIDAMEGALAQARGEVAARERDVEAARAQLLAATSIAAQAWDEASAWDRAMETARTRIETAPDGCVPSAIHEFEQSISTVVVIPMVSTAPPPGLHPVCAATASRDVPGDTSQDSITLRRSSGPASETDQSDETTLQRPMPVEVTGEAMTGRRSDDSAAITVRRDLNQIARGEDAALRDEPNVPSSPSGRSWRTAGRIAHRLSACIIALQVAGKDVMPAPWPRRADLGWWVPFFLLALYIAILPFVMSRCR